jgi:phosphoribosylanthranilate isomerase
MDRPQIPTRRPLLKVCGMTRAEDLEACREAGVDLTGFIFHPRSPRYVTPEQAAGLPRVGLRVGVFVSRSAEEVREIMDTAGLDLAQLHGKQDERFCEEVGPERVIRVFWPAGYDSLAELNADLARFAPVCRMFLLDSGTGGGGHGTTINWSGLKGLEADRPWLLAGGLTPGTVAEALATCRPDGLDLNSGLETAPGCKDAGLIQKAVKNIRHNNPFREQP